MAKDTVRIEVITPFAGDFGTGLPLVNYERGKQYNVPKAIGELWISRELARLAPEVIDGDAPAAKPRPAPTPEPTTEPAPKPKKIRNARVKPTDGGGR